MAKKLSAKAQAKKEDEEWRARSDLDTLRNAENIRNDQGRLNAVVRMAREEQKALAKVAKEKGAEKKKAGKKKAKK